MDIEKLEKAVKLLQEKREYERYIAGLRKHCELITENHGCEREFTNVSVPRFMVPTILEEYKKEVEKIEEQIEEL